MGVPSGAALHLARQVFGTLQFLSPSELATEKSPPEDEDAKNQKKTRLLLMDISPRF